MAHTTGPWHVDDSGQPTLVSVFGGVHESLVAQAIVGAGLTRSDAEANARLIAAAPELLDALRAFCGDYEAQPTTRDTSLKAAYLHALAVIAKAEGLG